MRTFDEYLEGLTTALAGVNREDFDALVGVLERAQADDRWVYIGGNGGSAATASHMVNDLVKAPADATGCRPIRAVGLADGTPLMTAFANDLEYAQAYARQIEAYGRPGDVLIVLSGSGNSGNVIEAARTARARGMTVVAMTGYDGGRLKALADVHVHVPCDCMAQVEDAHLVIEHAVVEVLKTALADAPKP